MTYDEILDLYVLDWNQGVKLHKIQIGILGRVYEFLFGSGEFYSKLESSMYNKYKIPLCEVIKHRKLKY